MHSVAYYAIFTAMSDKLSPIKVYRQQHGDMRQFDFGALFSPRVTPQTVCRWETGQLRVTAERAVEIEAVTGGEVRREVLRPDLFAAASVN